MANIAILGGTFDPVHFGHLRMAEVARDSFGMDRVIFVPNGHPPHKTGILAIPEHRFNMIDLATKNYGFESSFYECGGQNFYYTAETLEHFRDHVISANDRLFLIIGSDEALDLWKWRRYEDILRQFGILVGARSNCDVEQAFLLQRYTSSRDWTPDIKVMRDIGFNISSTELRNKLSAANRCASSCPT